MARPWGRHLQRTTPAALALAIGLACVLAGAGCASGGGTDAAATTIPVSVGVDYSSPGPYPVGRTRLELGDREAVVYYPADPAAIGSAAHVTQYSTADVLPEALRAFVPPSFSPVVALDAYTDAAADPEGPFPVVLYSHGFGGFDLVASQQLEHLASWGFVTAAPQHKERDLLAVATGQVTYDGRSDVTDLHNTLTVLRQENTRPGAPLQGSMDFDHVGAIGHSAGGRAVGLLATDPDVDVIIGQAPVAPITSFDDTQDDSAAAVSQRLAAETPPPKPSMILAGERDGVVPLDGVRALYSWLAAPKRLWVLAGAGHNSFTDQCAPIRAAGGLSSLADSLPIPASLLSLADDGCVEGFQDPALSLRVVNHLDTAELRRVFGADPTDASLDPAFVERLFPGAVADSASSP